MAHLADRCPNCSGLGVVADYGNGQDFYGPKECPDCVNGSIVVYPSDRLALWPGGPLCGSWPGRYAELKAQER